MTVASSLQVAYVPLETGDIFFVRPSPDGRFLAYPKGDRIDFFDVDHGRGRRHRQAGLGIPPERGRACGTRTVFISAAATDGQIRVWDASTGRLVARARPAGTSVSALDYSTDGSRLAIGELSGQVTMLDSADLTPVGRPVRVDDPVRAISAGPDNRTAVALTGFESATRGSGSAPAQQWARARPGERRACVTVRDVGFDASDDRGLARRHSRQPSAGVEES